MTTLPGGATVATIGLTAAENQQLTSILTTQSSGAPITVQSVAPTATLVQSAPEVLIGNIRTTTISNSVITATGGANNLVQVTVPTGGSGSVNNLILGDTVQNVVLTGTSANQISSLFAGNNTSVVVGDAGSNFVVLSSTTTVGANIVTGVGNDSVLGGGGNDIVRMGDMGIANGGNGADTLIGGTGSTTIGGGGGADSIVAGAGGGIFIGEAGDDMLVAGAGKDIFIFRTGDGSDQLVGFNPAQDTLALAYSGVNLTSIISNATVSGGNTTLTLPDGSTITVVGATGVNINWFTVK